MSIAQFLKQARKDRNWSQEQVAEMFGVSRVTYNLIENEKTAREPYRSQIEEIFDMSVDVLMKAWGQLPIHRIVDDETYEQVKDVMLYILSKTSNLPNVGKTVLYKILYFCEFDRYELHQERILGIDFVKLPRGPAPASFDTIMQRLEKDQAIVSLSVNYNGYLQQRYIINQEISNDILPIEKKKFVDDVIDTVGQMNAREVSDYSHGDIPRQVTKDMELIDINLALHRQYPYSVHALAHKKQLAQQYARMTWVFDDLAQEPDLYEDYR